MKLNSKRVVKTLIFARIKDKYLQLTRAEKKIADEVLTNGEKVVMMTAKELASECETAPSAIIRFCKSVGFSGFAQLKIELAKSIGLQNKDDVLRLPQINFGDKIENVFEKVFSSSIKALEGTLKTIDFDNVRKIAKSIKSARRLFFMGIGTSSVIATDAQYRFAQLGIDSVACTDLVFMEVNAINMNANDAVVCISHSGRTRAVVDAMRIAKKSGATTIAITSFADSPLAKESDYFVIAYDDEETYPTEAVSARIAHTCIIDAFMMAMASTDAETFEKHVYRRNSILRDLRY